MEKPQEYYSFIGSIARDFYISPSGKRIVTMKEDESQVINEVNFTKSLYELSESEIRDELDVEALDLTEAEMFYFAAEIKRRAGG